MLKALIKKQFMELGALYTRNRRRGQINAKAKGGAPAQIFVLVIAYAFLGFMFYQVGRAIAETMFAIGYRWLYYVLMGMFALIFGILGSVFSTYSGLYQAKDNETLLSMPIPPSKILAARMIVVFTNGLVYELIVMIPALIVGWIVKTPTVTEIVFQILLVLALGLIILSLSCALGWVVALIASRLKNKSIITVILSLALFAAYYWFYFRAVNALQNMLAQMDRIEKAMQRIYPLYQFGLAAEGSVTALLIFLAIAIGSAAIVWWILSKTFLRIVTKNRGQGKAKAYKETSVRSASVNQALMRKEWKRFLSSPAYMLNCGLGIVFLLAAAIYVLIRMQQMRALLSQAPSGGTGFIVILVTAAVCIIGSMIDITAPSVSLEGRQIWLLQSMPVPTKNILWAKQKLQLVLTLVPAWFLMAVMIIALRPGFGLGLLMVLFVTAFAFFMSALGLVLNLLKPNLNWTNETIPIKQSLAVFVSLFGGMALIVVFGLGYYFLMDSLSSYLYMIVWNGLMILGCLWLNHWLNTRGSAIFETL